jgi:hypothetical protein
MILRGTILLIENNRLKENADGEPYVANALLEPPESVFCAGTISEPAC